MKTLHLSAECYPAAKVGGLADVVGSLPQYLNGKWQKAGDRWQMADSKNAGKQREIEASVVIPKYRTEWIEEHSFDTVFSGKALLGENKFQFMVQQLTDSRLGFTLYIMDIPGRFDRPGIYSDPQSDNEYEDEVERWFSFQIAVLEWIKFQAAKPDIIHCHDHHTALVPFIITQCQSFEELRSIPTVFTVHNAEYQGMYSHEKQKLLPALNVENAGLLDWDGNLNSLAAGLKCSWQITTVSPTYMKELQSQGDGLEWLFANETQKSTGILNGIDTQFWNPETDEFLVRNYSIHSADKGKASNKKMLCRQFGLDASRPLISFIGRFAGEKGADLLPDFFQYMMEHQKSADYLVLGSGDEQVHKRLQNMSNQFIGYFDASRDHNEPLAHKIYAGSDFLLMPSRVEPCGLNPLYAMRYGTIPVVRETGGLKDTVTDITEANGNGITFSSFTVEAAAEALKRALKLYQDKNTFYTMQQHVMELDFSWEVAAKEYIEVYASLTEELE